MDMFCTENCIVCSDILEQNATPKRKNEWKLSEIFHWDLKLFVFLFENPMKNIMFVEKEIVCRIFGLMVVIHFNKKTNKSWYFKLNCLGTRIDEEIESHFHQKEWENVFIMKIPPSVIVNMKRSSTGIVELKCMYKESEETSPQILSEKKRYPCLTDKSLSDEQNEDFSYANSVKILANQLKFTLDKSLYTDITLKVGTDTIRAHKAIICGRSPVFRKMFEHDMAEKSDCIIDITDVEFSCFQKFVQFLYSCEFNETDLDSLCSLYYLADKYEVIDLRGLCGKQLISILSFENACRILALADQHSDTYLKKKTMRFMLPYLKEMTQTADWKEYIDSRLATEIIQNL